MAGEIENFVSSEAISLHSGSISLGRFESEPLCWERRSSFSHNRYLEEVEKYSTPGSVTQKKAYFEAHFKKKKSLLCEASESCDVMADQFSEIDGSNHTNDLQKIEHDNQGIQFTCYYENMDGLDDHGGSEVLDCEKERNEISPHDFQMDPFVSPVVAEICDLQQVESGELSQSQFECDTQKSINEDPEVEKSKVVDVAESADRLPDGGDQLPKNQTTANNCVEGMQKLQNPNFEASVQDLIQITSDTSKECEKDARRAEKESIKIRKEKQPLQKVVSNKSIQMKTSKDSKSLKAKPVQDNRSGNLRRLKKTGAAVQLLGSDKSECKLHHSSNRPKQTANICLQKPEVKLNTAGFCLRSDERADKRKQFYMKLEEKVHAKEAEVNLIQAKTQEEKEAQLKELRRSLNFKATPLPSFYNGVVSQGSENKKAASSNAKSTNLRSKCKSTSPGSSRSPAYLTPSKQPCLSTIGFTSTNVQPHCPSTVLPSEAANSSLSMSTSLKCTMQTGRKMDAAGKKERVKQKDASIQKQCDSESSKPKNGARAEGRRFGNRNSGSERIKMLKGNSIGEGSGVGRLSIDIGS